LFKNKLLNIMLVILIILTLIGAVAFTVVWYMNKEDNYSGAPSIDDVLKRTVEMEEITTNIQGDQFVAIKLNVEADSENAKEELEKRAFQVKNILVLELSAMTAEQFKSKEGLLEIESLLKMKINEIMQNGVVERVYITDRRVP
jgi:flagellar FliL protein